MKAQEYEALITEGNTLREVYRPDRALAKYDQALTNRVGPRNWYCHQQAGVCLQMMGRYEEALVRYAEASAATNSAGNLGHIERDRAESLRALGRLDKAEACIKDSQTMLALAGETTGVLASQGFQARILVDRGRLVEAIELFRVVDGNLSELDPTLALYNKLHLASALSHAGCSAEMNVVLAEVDQLLVDGYGSSAHRRRMNALRSGGWRAEAVVSYGGRAMLRLGSKFRS